MAVTRIDRITRIKMLLTSYLDARPAPTSNTSERTTGSRERSMPNMGALWRQGSYAELEEVLESLNPVTYQRIFRCFIWQPDRRKRSLQVIFRRAKAKDLEKDLERLSRAMPRRIRVPLVVIENWKDYVAEKSARSADAPYTDVQNSRSAPAAPVQTGEPERERPGGHD